MKIATPLFIVISVAAMSTQLGAVDPVEAESGGDQPERVNIESSPGLTPCWQLLEPPRGDVLDLTRLEFDGPLRHWRNGYLSGRSRSENRGGALAPTWRHNIVAFCAKRPTKTYSDAVEDLYENHWVE
jgi:hypothetical protein